MIVFKTKYANISQSYLESWPHYKAKQIFYFTLIAYTIGLVKLISLIPFVENENTRVRLLALLSIVLVAFIYQRLSRKGKTEEVVKLYFERREALIKSDGFIGYLYFIFSFLLPVIYAVVAYIW